MHAVHEAHMVRVRVGVTEEQGDSFVMRLRGVTVPAEKRSWQAPETLETRKIYLRVDFNSASCVASHLLTVFEGVRRCQAS